jgi:hypothetical protein
VLEVPPIREQLLCSDTMHEALVLASQPFP